MMLNPSSGTYLFLLEHFADQKDIHVIKMEYPRREGYSTTFNPGT